ncbi:hypothetical protein AB0F93_00570 [Micromonospora tulbaghiae]|uniref:hypothetical protein n=1 Tax=Micromonospora tulbaghiae TaxID=479978 RepID=UPI003320C771
MPDPTIPDRGRADARSAFLTATLSRIAVTVGHRAEQPGVLPGQLLADLDAIGRTAAGAVGADPVVHRPEYEVLWHADGDDTSIVMSEAHISRLSRARSVGRGRIGMYAITRYTVQRCWHTTLANGYQVISPWEPVDDRGQVFACVTCGEQVFQGRAVDGAVSLVDAGPMPDGELTLIPNDEDGGQPTIVPATYPEPGHARYRRHRDGCTPPPLPFTATVQRSVPPNPPFDHIVVQHPDGRTERIDVPEAVTMPDGSTSRQGPDRLRVPLAAAGYRIVGEMTAPPGSDYVYVWRLEHADAAATETRAG